METDVVPENMQVTRLF